MGKFARSWALAKASLSVLRSDKELLVFPLLSLLAVVLVAATFLLPLSGLGMLEQADRGDGLPLGFYLLGFAFYLVQYFVVFFFTTALVGANSTTTLQEPPAASVAPHVPPVPG